MAAYLISNAGPTLTHMQHAPMSTSLHAGPRHLLFRRLCDSPLAGMGSVAHGAAPFEATALASFGSGCLAVDSPTRILCFDQRCAVDRGSGALAAPPSSASPSRMRSRSASSDRRSVCVAIAGSSCCRTISTGGALCLEDPVAASKTLAASSASPFPLRRC